MSIECGRGHLYDPNIYSSCPYCNSSQQAISFTGVSVGEGGKTMPISGAQNAGPDIRSGINIPVGGQPVTADGKTLPPRGFVQAQQRLVTDENKTTGMMKKKLGVDPAVGWLVCVNGKHKGQDYKLRGKINTIGRSEKMDICIRDDDTISKENHARLSYSEKNNRFNLIPAENTNIIYLNGEEIFAATPLNAYDFIDFGETKLVFVPLCCEKFDWSTSLEDDD